MFGYATNETPECMPLTLMLAHRLARRLAEARRAGELPWLLPDCKTQVTVEYAACDGLRGTIGYIRPSRIHTIVISTQHAASVSTQDLRTALLKNIAMVRTSSACPSLKCLKMIGLLL